MIHRYENKKLKIKLNRPLRGFQTGHEMRINVDKNGIPFDRYWRDRFKDAPIDNCLEVIKEG